MDQLKDMMRMSTVQRNPEVTLIAEIAKAIGVSPETLVQDYEKSGQSRAYLTMRLEVANLSEYRKRMQQAMWVLYMEWAHQVGVGPKGSSKEHKAMMRKHRQWPIGMRVMVLTKVGYIEGRVVRHNPKWRHSCDVDFGDYKVTEHGSNWLVVPFRNLKPLPNQSLKFVPPSQAPRLEFCADPW